MCHFVTCVHIAVTIGYFSDALWDLCDGSLVKSQLMGVEVFFMKWKWLENIKIITTLLRWYGEVSGAFKKYYTYVVFYLRLKPTESIATTYDILWIKLHCYKTERFDNTFNHTTSNELTFKVTTIMLEVKCNVSGDQIREISIFTPDPTTSHRRIHKEFTSDRCIFLWRGPVIRTFDVSFVDRNKFFLDCKLDSN